MYISTLDNYTEWVINKWEKLSNNILRFSPIFKVYNNLW